jgi:hypothetical protein
MDPATTFTRFPLIARTRPACSPLTTRVARICDQARAAARDGDPTGASAVHNQAALLASDSGQPDLASQWCHDHAEAYLSERPLDARAARHALEPLVNLARLHIRDGHGQKAYQILDALYTAVQTRTDTVIDGIRLPAAALTRSADDHGQLIQWLWTVHLSDGPRALISAGRWHDAHAHLQRHNGIGQRLLDGRQVAVITCWMSGDHAGALDLLKNTAIGDPWEQAVLACLHVICLDDPEQPRRPDLSEMLRRYRELAHSPGLAVFHTRLGLSVIDACGTDPASQDVVTDLIQETLTADDGYAARDVLAHSRCRAQLLDEQRQHLAELVAACGLDRQALRDDLLAELHLALAATVTVFQRTAVPRSLHSPAGMARIGAPPDEEETRETSVSRSLPAS